MAFVLRNAPLHVEGFLPQEERPVAGLVHLHRLPRLQRINLAGTNVTDAGLVYLKDLTHLKELTLTDTKVTDAGVAKLQKHLPNCKIRH